MKFVQLVDDDELQRLDRGIKIGSELPQNAKHALRHRALGWIVL